MKGEQRPIILVGETAHFVYAQHQGPRFLSRFIIRGVIEVGDSAAKEVEIVGRRPTISRADLIIKFTILAIAYILTYLL
jgi:hypothetical protein